MYILEVERDINSLKREGFDCGEQVFVAEQRIISHYMVQGFKALVLFQWRLFEVLWVGE